MRLDSSGLALGSSYVGTAPPSGGAIIQGNVGIGTTAPVVKLDISGSARISADQNIIFGGYTSSSDFGPYIGYQTSTDTLNIVSGFNTASGNEASGGIRFGVASGSTWSEKVRINSSGNVGIGTTGPGEKLDILGWSIKIGADWASQSTRTDSTNKGGLLVLPHYLNTEEPINGVFIYTNSGDNFVRIGGGTSGYNTATKL